jgi:hypothetical protein
MVYLQTKNPKFGKFLNALELNILAYFTAILFTFCHLVYVMAILVSSVDNW